MKKCMICGKDKPLSEFNKHNKKKDGKQSHCRECNRERSRAYYDRNREKHKANVQTRRKKYLAHVQEEIKNYLRSNPCIDCGENDIRVLEFDHLRDKEKSICDAIGSGWSWERIKAEIAKCAVRCANCHRIKTTKDFGWYKGV